MSEAQRLKHIADRMPQQLTKASELDAAEPTPDGLGTWEGGRSALRGSIRWVAEKERSQRTGNTKNAPGLDYPSKITHRQDVDFNEIHTDADGSFFLYNAKTDKWDIPTPTTAMPYYEDEKDNLWAYNYSTGAWDVPVTVEYEGDEPATTDAVPGVGDLEQAGRGRSLTGTGIYDDAAVERVISETAPA